MKTSKKTFLIIRLVLTFYFIFNVENIIFAAENEINEINEINVDSSIDKNLKLKKQNQKIMDAFKKYDEKTFNLEGYNLKIYKKGSIPILFYEHKNTKAKIIFQVISKQELKNKQYLDYYSFKSIAKSDKGLAHVCEHCLFNYKFLDYVKEKAPGSIVNATTSLGYLNFVISSKADDAGFIRLLFKNLINPQLNKEKFNIEKKRVINEQMDNLKLSKVDRTRMYDVGGVPSEVKKITLKDVKKFYKKYIKPSNLMIFKNITSFNPLHIKKYLNLIDREYLSKYDYENIDVKFEDCLKNKDRYSKNMVDVTINEDLLKGEEKKTIKAKLKKSKYLTNLIFQFDRLNITAKQRDLFILNLNEILKTDLNKYIKELGYDDVNISCNMNELILSLSGDLDSLFSEEKLIQNSKNIVIFIQEKLKNWINQTLTSKDGIKTLEILLKKNNQDDMSNSFKYKTENLFILILKSLLFYNEPFSTKIFDINDKNEILEDEKTTVNNIKENLNIFEILKKEGPTYIDVKENNYKILSSDEQNEEIKKGMILYYLPIKIDEKSFFMFDLSSCVLRQYLSDIMIKNKGLTYKMFKGTRCFKDLVGYVIGNYKSKENVLKYLYQNFNNIKKYFKIDNKKFEIYKKNLKYEREEGLKKFIKVEKKFNIFEKKLQNYLVGNENEINSNLTIAQFFNLFLKESYKNDLDLSFKDDLDAVLGGEKNLSKNFIFHEAKEQYEYQLILSRFLKNFDNLDKTQKITKEFIKNFKIKIFDKVYDIIKFTIRELKKECGKIEDVKKEEVQKTIKEKASLIDKKDLELLDRFFNIYYENKSLN